MPDHPCSREASWRGGHDQGPGEGHDLGAGRRVRHGLGRLLSRGAPRAPGRGRGLLDRPPPGDRRAVRALRRRDGLRHRGRAPARPRGLPGRRSGRPRAGLAGLPQDPRPGRPRRRPLVVALRPGRVLAPARGPGEHGRGAPAPPGDPRRLRGRRRLRRLGGQGTADGIRVGARGPRRPRGRDLRVGRRDRARRTAHGQHVAGGVPLAEPARRRLRGHVAGGELRAQRLRAVRHDGQRVGVDRGPLGHARRPARRARVLCAGGAARRDTSRGASSRAARTCALRTTACASAPPPARARRSTPRRRTSAFAASCARPVPTAHEALHRLRAHRGSRRPRARRLRRVQGGQGQEHGLRRPGGHQQAGRPAQGPHRLHGDGRRRAEQPQGHHQRPVEDQGRPGRPLRRPPPAGRRTRPRPSRRRCRASRGAWSRARRSARPRPS